MRSSILLASAIAVASAAACGGATAPPTAPESFAVPLHVGAAARDGVPQNHRTHLSGSEEVFTPAVPGAPTPADSEAQGQAIFQVAADGRSFEYKLIASNIENITQAHIHCGPAGANGGIMVWLYPGPTSVSALPGGAGRHDGVLAEGTIVEGASLHVRPVASSAACPGGVTTFEHVLQRIRAGEAYVNVHTSDGVAPANTGPGDFPGGELRGQIR